MYPTPASVLSFAITVLCALAYMVWFVNDRRIDMANTIYRTGKISREDFEKIKNRIYTERTIALLLVILISIGAPYLIRLLHLE